MKRRTLELVALTAICSQVLSCTEKQTTITSQKQANWSEASPEAITAAEPEEEKTINARTYFAAGRLYEQQEVFNQAIAQYNQALSLDPENVATLNRLGMVYARIGRQAEAERLLIRAVELEPGSALLRNNLGFIYVAQKRWADAEAEFNNAIKLKPDFNRAHINLGMVLSKLDRYDEALRTFLEVLPEADAYYNLGLLLRARHRNSEAADAFRLALEINPGFTAAETQLAQLQPRLRLMDSLETKSSRNNWQALSGRERESHPTAPAVVAEQPVETMMPAIEAEPVPNDTQMAVAPQSETVEEQPVQQAEPIAISDPAPAPAPAPVVQSPSQAAPTMPPAEHIEVMAINEPTSQPAKASPASRKIEPEGGVPAKKPKAKKTFGGDPVEIPVAQSAPEPIAIEVIAVNEINDEPAIAMDTPEQDAAPVAEKTEPITADARPRDDEVIETLPVMEIIETREIAQANQTSEPIETAKPEPVAETPIIAEKPTAAEQPIDEQAEEIPAEMIMLVDLGDEEDASPTTEVQPITESAPMAAATPPASQMPADEAIEVIPINTDAPKATVADARPTAATPVEPIAEPIVADKSPATPIMPAMLTGPEANAKPAPEPQEEIELLTIDEPAKDTVKAKKVQPEAKPTNKAKKHDVIEAEPIAVTSEPEVIVVNADNQKKADK